VRGGEGRGWGRGVGSPDGLNFKFLSFMKPSIILFYYIMMINDMMPACQGFWAEP